MEETEDNKELQLLSAPSLHPPSLTHLSTCKFASPQRPQSTVSDPLDVPSLDLKLSISLQAIQPQPDFVLPKPPGEYGDSMAEHSYVEVLKWQAAEQIRLAAIEKAYAERVRELTRREIELAQLEFARARYVWERAREEVEKAERMKEQVIHQMGSASIDITCQACQQRFQP